METYKSELEAHLKKFAKKSDVEYYSEEIVLEEKPDGKDKKLVKEFFETKEKNEKRLEKLKN